MVWFDGRSPSPPLDDFEVPHVVGELEVDMTRNDYPNPPIPAVSNQSESYLEVHAVPNTTVEGLNPVPTIKLTNPIAQAFSRLVTGLRPLSTSVHPSLSFNPAENPSPTSSTSTSTPPLTESSASLSTLRHSWSISDSSNKKLSSTIPQRRSWEPKSMLNTPPILRQLSHRRGAVSLDFSASELTRRNELDDYERALDLIAIASNEPMMPAFPSSVVNTAASSSFSQDDIALPLDHYFPTEDNPLQGPDVEMTPTQESSWWRSIREVHGEEAANLGSDIHEVCVLLTLIG